MVKKTPSKSQTALNEQPTASEEADLMEPVKMRRRVAYMTLQPELLEPRRQADYKMKVLRRLGKLQAMRAQKKFKSDIDSTDHS